MVCGGIFAKESQPGGQEYYLPPPPTSTSAVFYSGARFVTYTLPPAIDCLSSSHPVLMSYAQWETIPEGSSLSGQRLKFPRNRILL